MGRCLSDFQSLVLRNIIDLSSGALTKYRMTQFVVSLKILRLSEPSARGSRQPTAYCRTRPRGFDFLEVAVYFRNRDDEGRRLELSYCHLSQLRWKWWWREV